MVEAYPFILSFGFNFTSYIFFAYNSHLSGNPFFPFLFELDENNQFFWLQDSVTEFSKATVHFKDQVDRSSFLSRFNFIWDLGFNKSKFNDAGAYIVGPLWTFIFLLIPTVFSIKLFRKKKINTKFIILSGSAFIFPFLWLLAFPVQRYLAPHVVILSLWTVYIVSILDIKIQKNGLLFYLFLFLFTGL